MDYSNTIIYKISCLDSNITECYVGHTIDFCKRKKSHKRSCENIKSDNYNCKLYKFIRNNGGWNNWKMEIVAFYNCNDLHEAKEKEQKHFNELQATLNSVEPLSDKKNILNNNKKICVTNSELTTNYDETTKYYICYQCNLKTQNKKDFNKHINTKKHLTKILKAQQISNSKKYTCLCGKSYKSYSGLWKHKKLCSYKDTNYNSDKTIFAINKNEQLQTINYLVKENLEFKKKLLENRKQLSELNLQPTIDI
jgi:GIY-YIG catalytic domain